MKKYFSISLGLTYSTLIAIFLVSCEQNANVDLPEVPAKLVVNAFISPQDTVIMVRVTKSSPMFQSTQVDVNAPVTDATVRIFGNSTSIVLPYNSLTERYTVSTTSFPIIAGNEYSIEVSAPQMETVTAKTTVPGAVPADFTGSITYTIDSTDMYYWDYNVSMHNSFTDPSQSEDLYRMSSWLLVYDPFNLDTNTYSIGERLFPDADQNGTLVNSNSELSFSITSPIAGNDSAVAINLVLSRCSMEYYYYHLSLRNYSGGDDPFSEPTLMYSNVEKGYGVFAGCSYKMIRLNF